MTRAKSQQAVTTSVFVCHTKHDATGQLKIIQKMDSWLGQYR